MTHTPPPLSAATENRIYRARLFWYRVVGVCTVLSCGLLLGGLFTLLNNSEQARASRVSTAASLRLLVECTTPPNQRTPPEPHPSATDCYVRNQAAQAGFLGEPRGPINTVAVAAAACGAANPGDVAGTRRCVQRGLTR